MIDDHDLIARIRSAGVDDAPARHFDAARIADLAAARTMRNRRVAAAAGGVAVIAVVATVLSLIVPSTGPGSSADDHRAMPTASHTAVRSTPESSSPRSSADPCPTCPETLPPISVSLAGHMHGRSGALPTERGRVGQSVAVPVVLRWSGRGSATVDSLLIVAGKPGASISTAFGPGSPSGVIGRRHNQVDAVDVYQGPAVDGLRRTARFSFPAPGRYPIAVRLTFTFGGWHGVSVVSEPEVVVIK